MLLISFNYSQRIPTFEIQKLVELMRRSATKYLQMVYRQYIFVRRYYDIIQKQSRILIVRSKSRFQFINAL